MARALSPEEQCVLEAIRTGHNVFRRIRVQLIKSGFQKFQGQHREADKLMQRMRKAGLITYNFSYWKICEEKEHGT